MKSHQRKENELHESVEESNDTFGERMGKKKKKKKEASSRHAERRWKKIN